MWLLIFQKKKPKRLPFVIVKAFKSEDDFISWQKEQNFSWSITKSNVQQEPKQPSNQPLVEQKLFVV